MALTDINFQEGDRMDFISEIPADTLHAPLDILIENSGTQYLLLETPLVTGGAGSIFIMSE